MAITAATNFFDYLLLKLASDWIIFTADSRVMPPEIISEGWLASVAQTFVSSLSISRNVWRCVALQRLACCKLNEEKNTSRMLWEEFQSFFDLKAMLLENKFHYSCNETVN